MYVSQTSRGFVLQKYDVSWTTEDRIGSLLLQEANKVISRDMPCSGQKSCALSNHLAVAVRDIRRLREDRMGPKGL